LVATHRDRIGGSFEVYRDFEGRYRWRLWAAEGGVSADSGQSYESEFAARRAAIEAKRHAEAAVVEGEPADPV
jgi:uncharacterized protein YegP (UPF0339 family)